MATQIGIVQTRKLHPFWFNCEPTRFDHVITEDSVTETTRDDLVFETSSTSTVGDGFDMLTSVSYYQSTSFTAFTYSSSNESVATVSATGYVTPLSAGTTTITVTATSVEGVTRSRTWNLTITVRASTFSTRVTGGTAGSVRKASTDYVDALLDAVTDVAAAKPLFSTLNHQTPTYVRNTSCWGNDFVSQLTCESPWNSRDGDQRSGTLITDRHIYLAKHYPLAKGDTLRFVNASNQVFTYTITGIGNSDLDIQIATLNATVDASIYRAKLPPTDWADYFAYRHLTVNGESTTQDYSRGAELRGIYIDQESKLLAFYLSGLASTFTVGWAYASQWNMQSAPSYVTDMYEVLVSGDSGNPIFMHDGTNLILCGAFYSPVLWPSPIGNLSRINAAIDAADTDAGISLTNLRPAHADWSGFDTY